MTDCTAGVVRACRCGGLLPCTCSNDAPRDRLIRNAPESRVGGCCHLTVRDLNRAKAFTGGVEHLVALAPSRRDRRLDGELLAINLNSRRKVSHAPNITAMNVRDPDRSPVRSWGKHACANVSTLRSVTLRLAAIEDCSFPTGAGRFSPLSGGAETMVLILLVSRITQRRGELMGILLFIVFGLIVGLLARALLPGRQSMGLAMTAILGMVGSLIGGLIGNLLAGRPAFDLHGAGFIGSLVCSILLLAALGASSRRRLV